MYGKPTPLASEVKLWCEPKQNHVEFCFRHSPGKRAVIIRGTSQDLSKSGIKGGKLYFSKLKLKWWKLLRHQKKMGFEVKLDSVQPSLCFLLHPADQGTNSVLTSIPPSSPHLPNGLKALSTRPFLLYLSFPTCRNGDDSAACSLLRAPQSSLLSPPPLHHLSPYYFPPAGRVCADLLVSVYFASLASSSQRATMCSVHWYNTTPRLVLKTWQGSDKYLKNMGLVWSED